MNDAMKGGTVNTVLQYINTISRGFWFVSFATLVLMMLLTATDVFGRYFFKHPVRDALELTELLQVITVAAGLGYTQKLKGHIAVDLLTNQLPQSWQKGCEAFGNLICLMLFALFSWQAFNGALMEWNNGVTVGSYEIPVWPFYGFLAMGCLVTFLSFLSDLLTLFIPEEITK